MKLRSSPNYLFVGIVFFALSLLLLYSNIIIYSLNFYKPRPPYWDLTNGINPLWNCFRHSGLKLFSLEPSTFPSLEGCRNFNYGYFSLFSFGIFHIISNNQIFWGILQIATFSFFFSKVYFDLGYKRSEFFIAFLALLSPGIFLLEASGNMDIQIAILILTALLFFRRGNVGVALVLVCISALFKFYTSPLLLILTLLAKKRKKRILGIGLIFLTGSMVIFQMIWTPLPPFPGGAQNKFGAMIIGNYMRKAGVTVTNTVGEILGVLLVLLLVAIFFFLRNSESDLMNSDNQSPSISAKIEFEQLTFLLMGGTSIVCYFAALSVDYRLVFVALAGITLLRLEQVKVKFATRLFPLFWLVSLWFTFPFAYLSKYIGSDLQPIGDIAMIVTMAYFIFQGINTFKFLYRRGLN